MANHTVESLINTFREEKHRQIAGQIPADAKDFLNVMMKDCDEPTAWKLIACYQEGQKQGLKWANDKIGSARDQAGKEKP